MNPLQAHPAAPIDRLARPAGIDAELVRRRVGELPALPQAVLQALAMLRSDHPRIDDCAARIAIDPALTARTLRLANSAFYGVSGRVATLQDAIHVLGIQTLAALLTTAAVLPRLGDRQRLGADYDVFWRHALGTALASQALARLHGIGADLAFTAGLLHDIGRLALATHFPDEHLAVARYAADTDVSVLSAERRLLAIDHAEVGAMIARHWLFPAAVVQAIALHHEPPAPSEPGHRATLVDIVHLADAVAHALDLSQLPDERVPDIDPDAWARLALTPAQGLQLLAHTEAGVQSLALALDPQH
jgi:putative nucleotidyltransferase with HDIG domain